MAIRKTKGLAEASALPGLDLVTDEAEAPPGHLGHRARMREKLLRAGPDALLDHELLEMVLFLALPRTRTITGKFVACTSIEFTSNCVSQGIRLSNFPKRHLGSLRILISIEQPSLRMAFEMKVIDKSRK